MLNNIEFIKNNFLHFDDDTFYLIKIFVRKKDSISNNSQDVFKNIFGSHNERIVCSFVVTSMEDFDKYAKVSKYICDNLPYSRAYLNINPKSKDKALLELIDTTQHLIQAKLKNDNLDISKKIHKISYSILSKNEVNVSRNKNYVIFDIDIFEEKFQDKIKENLEKLNYFIKKINEANISFIQYKTINGMHLIFKHKDLNILKNPKSEYFNIYNEFANNDFVDIKQNAAALLYTKN